MPKLDEYLRIGEAAAYLGVAKNTLRNWAAAGKVASHRHPVSGYRLFLVRDLDELLTRTEQSGTPPRPKPR
jgi:excisionase family DNA binding protein